MGAPPDRRYEPTVGPAGPPERDELIRLAGRALAHLDGQRGGAVYRDVEARSLPIADTVDADLDAADEGEADILLGRLGEVPVGYSVVRYEQSRGGRIALLTDIYVEPEARGVGVGRSMMDAVIERAAHAGCSGVQSEALPGDRATKNFFEASGLVARKITVFRDLLPAEPRTGS